MYILSNALHRFPPVYSNLIDKKEPFIFKDRNPTYLNPKIRADTERWTCSLLSNYLYWSSCCMTAHVQFPNHTLQKGTESGLVVKRKVFTASIPR